MNVLYRSAATAARSLTRPMIASAKARAWPAAAAASLSTTTMRRTDTPPSRAAAPPAESDGVGPHQKPDITSGAATTTTTTDDSPFKDRGLPILRVSGLSYHTTDQDLAESFGRFGALGSMRTVYLESGLRMTYIEFQDLAAATAARDAAHLKWFQGRQITARLDSTGEPWHGGGSGGRESRRRGEQREQREQRPNKRAWREAAEQRARVAEAKAPSATLYVSALPRDVTDADLAELFRGVEGVRLARMCMGQRSGLFRGFGWVEFHSIEEATKAMELLQGRVVDGRAVRVEYHDERPHSGTSKTVEGRFRAGRLPLEELRAERAAQGGVEESGPAAVEEVTEGGAAKGQ